jgi:hypothetical protein
VPELTKLTETIKQLIQEREYLRIDPDVSDWMTEEIRQIDDNITYLLADDPNTEEEAFPIQEDQGEEAEDQVNSASISTLSEGAYEEIAEEDDSNTNSEADKLEIESSGDIATMQEDFNEAQVIKKSKKKQVKSSKDIGQKSCDKKQNTLDKYFGN